MQQPPSEPGSPFQPGAQLTSANVGWSQYAQEYQQQKDSEHLNLLSIFYFVMAGMSLLGLVMQCFMFLFLEAFFAAMQASPQGGQAPPKEFMVFFASMLAVVCVISLTQGILNVLCGLFMRKRQHRTFSFVVAGINCLQFPFGMALGVFTFVVLMRESVRQLYADQAARTTNGAS